MFVDVSLVQHTFLLEYYMRDIFMAFLTETETETERVGMWK